MDEFSFIARLLAPLAAKEALGLKDDAAVLAPPKGQQLVITTDALIQGVHFIGDEAPGLIARKLLRVNLSDLAAMGAKPWGYFLALMLPESATEAWLKGFAEGLRRDQKEYGISLMGGDTTRTKGSLSLSVTALGTVPKGKALKRSGARVGDNVYVSGTIGDGALGLEEAIDLRLEAQVLAAISQAPIPNRTFLLHRYQLPEPRLKLGQALRGIATACMDISDGLMQDLGHICAASEVGAEVRWANVPLSRPAKVALRQLKNPHDVVLAGGDDYELLFTAPPSFEKKRKAIAASSGVAITCIGRITKGRQAIVLDEKGKQITLLRSGYRHF